MVRPLQSKFQGPDRDYAVNLVYRICCLAADLEFFERTTTRGTKTLAAAVERHDAAVLFNWLVDILSYQGIADRIASEYLRCHGGARFSTIEASLAEKLSCPKLISYWQFHGCGYEKSQGTCARPEYIKTCPLPKLPLRNGHLNQMAYSLFLFFRDVAEGDLVAWIDGQLEAADNDSADSLENMRTALLVPLRGIYGVSDKVLSMALADLLLAAGRYRPRWAAVGAGMIAVDRLVHNFLHRTGILRRLDAEHAYGPICYDGEHCVGIIGLIAAAIDARQFNRLFPKSFPRFVQHAIWRYCAGSGLDICNGNNIEDRAPCAYTVCRLHSHCDRLALRSSPKTTQKTL